MFGEFNLPTGERKPETFEGHRAHLELMFPAPSTFPAAVRDEWGIALDYYALGVEQANTERFQLYGPLTRDALFRATIVVEMALRDRLKLGDVAMTMYPLVERAIRAGVAPGPFPLTRKQRADDPSELGGDWDFIIEVRNQYAHGLSTKPTFGPLSMTPFKVVWDMLTAIYASLSSAAPPNSARDAEGKAVP